ncbi:DUSP9 [Symbiodinium sp. CCMP2592]|nr:DUSP9 [Symbiodinium sp. CCMP2592]
MELQAALQRRRDMETGAIWASQITEEHPVIWLGTGTDASNRGQLQRQSVQRVLNVADDVPCFFLDDPDIQYCRLDITDFGGDAGISRAFTKAIDFVRDAPQGVATLVHCANGSNRSPTVVVALMMALCRMTLREAWDLVKAKRSAMLPLHDNVNELVRWEIEQTGQSTASARRLSSWHGQRHGPTDGSYGDGRQRHGWRLWYGNAEHAQVDRRLNAWTAAWRTRDAPTRTNGRLLLVAGRAIHECIMLSRCSDCRSCCHPRQGQQISRDFGFNVRWKHTQNAAVRHMSGRWLQF